MIMMYFIEISYRSSEFDKLIDLIIQIDLITSYRYI